MWAFKMECEQLRWNVSIKDEMWALKMDCEHYQDGMRALSRWNVRIIKMEREHYNLKTHGFEKYLNRTSE